LLFCFFNISYFFEPYTFPLPSQQHPHGGFFRGKQRGMDPYKKIQPWFFQEKPMEERIPITPEGLEKIKSELLTLVSKERPAVVKAIAEAREHGDLRENAEYHAAKEHQGFIEGRIQQINARMPKFQVVDPAAQKSDKILFGAKVTVENLDSGETLSYQIVGTDEADLKVSRISYQSPIASALIGKSLGDIVRINIPKGAIEVEITEVEYS